MSGAGDLEVGTEGRPLALALSAPGTCWELDSGSG